LSITSVARERHPGGILESGKTALPGASHECCGAFRRTHGTLAPPILRVRRIGLEGVIASVYDAS